MTNTNNRILKLVRHAWTATNRHIKLGFHLNGWFGIDFNGVALQINSLNLPFVCCWHVNGWTIVPLVYCSSLFGPPGSDGCISDTSFYDSTTMLQMFGVGNLIRVYNGFIICLEPGFGLFQESHWSFNVKLNQFTWTCS